MSRIEAIGVAASGTSSVKSAPKATKRDLLVAASKISETSNSGRNTAAVEAEVVRRSGRQSRPNGVGSTLDIKA